MAALATALTVAGYNMSQEFVVDWVAVTNRALAVFAILGAALVGVQRRAYSKRKAARFARADAEKRAETLVGEAKTAALDIEQRLAESEEKYRLLFETSEDPMWVIIDKNFELCNEAAVKILGYASREELQNTHPSQLSPPEQMDDRPSFEKAEEMMNLALKKGHHRFEWIHRRKNGEDFPVEVTLTRIPFAGEDAIYCVWRDITERKHAEDEAITARNAAMAANQAKSDFLSNMSHELRTPLNAIIGFSEIIKSSKEFQPEFHDYIARIGESGHHLLEIINDILDLSRIEAGKMEAQKLVINLRHLIQRCRGAD